MDHAGYGIGASAVWQRDLGRLALLCRHIGACVCLYIYIHIFKCTCGDVARDLQ